jgi:very-short-patch-repair endonuclease
MNIDLVERWARAHHGLVTLEHASSVGISDDAWWRAVRRGRIHLLHPGVARLPGTVRTREQRIAAAVLAAGPAALASHRSSAYLWGIERPDDDPVEVLVPRAQYRLELEGVVIHRPRDLGDLGRSVREGVPTTNPLRMLCDLAAVDPAAIGAAVEHVIIAGLARPTGLRALVDRHARKGRTGVTALRAAVQRWPLGDKPADSVLEPAMARLLDRHRLPPAQFHAVIDGLEVDFWILGTPLVIECDGWEYHVKRQDRWQRDRERDAHLSTAGYVTLRLTYDHITRRAASTARRIELLLDRWAPGSVAAARCAARSGAP